MDGDTPEMPAPGYKWRNIDELNLLIWRNYQDVKLSTAIKRVRLSHQRIMLLMEGHNDEEIFTKKYYKWTKTSNLYSYLQPILQITITGQLKNMK
ncbi:ClbS/DfsB family four-helix bundle protein [Psychrobacillus sp. NPDC093180]|uniref:ClbS/DfsB family four-helix bundle protein n=1 Tax=Psychrobacillus sp. NPDC093180 TaxID=3364489 RepID=UPI0038004BAC